MTIKGLKCTTDCKNNSSHCYCRLDYVRIQSGVCRDRFSINSKNDEKIYAYMKEKIKLKKERLQKQKDSTKGDKTMNERGKQDIIFNYDSNLCVLEEIEYLLDLIAGK